MRKILYIFLVVLISCSQNSEKQDVVVIEENIAKKALPELQPQEVLEMTENVSENLENIFDHDFLNLFTQNRRNLRYFKTVLLQNTLLYAVDGDESTSIKTIPSGTAITILAQNNSNINRYYLVKIDGDDNMWSGWIKEEYIENYMNEAILIGRFSTGPTGRWLRTLSANISTRNDILITTTGWSGDIIVVRRNGEIMHRISVEELFAVGYNASVMRWATDENKVWVRFNADAVTAGFGIFDIKTGELILFDPPYGFAMNFALDPDSGYIWYDDFPFIACAFTFEDIRNSGRIFHLFAYNFFTEEERVIIDTNIGQGFIIRFDRINGLSFERANF